MKNDEMRDRFLASLRKLAQNTPIDKITVRQISETAGVSTQTFYNYFPDKYELIQWAYRKRLDRLFDELLSHKIDFEGFLRSYLSNYKENARYIINAATNVKGQNSYVKESSLYFCSCIEKEVSKELEEDEIPLNYKLIIEMYVAGFSNLVLHWLDSEDIEMEDIIIALKESVPIKLKEVFIDKFTGENNSSHNLHKYY